MDHRSSAWVDGKGTSYWTPDSDDSRTSGVGEVVGAIMSPGFRAPCGSALDSGDIRSLGVLSSAHRARRRKLLAGCTWGSQLAAHHKASFVHDSDGKLA
jgi:hypothetical protein